MDDVIRTKERYQESIMEKENVTGIGVGYKKTRGKRTDEYGIVVLVEKKLPLSLLRRKDVIKKEFDGITTDIQEIGSVEALITRAPEPPRVRTDKWRPAPGGVSIGHYHGSSGTLGITVTRRKTGEKLILSNNHVLARANEAKRGDPVLQPGPFDGGRKSDEIAELYQYIPLSFVSTPAEGLVSKAASAANVVLTAAGSRYRLVPVQVNTHVNTVDAAVALPVRDNSVEDEILNIGRVENTQEPELGMVVEKSGRTTGYNAGVVDVLETAIKVSYPYQRSAVFDHQVLTTLISRSGDSGSVVVSGKKAVGLLFAGSEQCSLFSPFTLVLDALHLDV